jgi:hypothetical protein
MKQKKEIYDIQMADFITGFNEDVPSVDIESISFTMPLSTALIPNSTQNAMIHIVYTVKKVKKWIQLTPCEAEKIGLINLNALRKYTDIDIL